MKKLLSVIAFSLILLLPVFAMENFTVDDYDVEISIGADGVHHVTETMDLDFWNEGHGIYRDIQYRFSNPGAFDVKASVDNIVADTETKVDREDGFVTIRLGSPDEVISGKHRFTLEYDYGMRFDLYDDYDEFYYNIVSPAWDTVMDTVSFTIHLPEAVEPENIWLTRGWGEDDSHETDSWRLSSDGMTVTGTVHSLENYEALTLRIEMREGYFSIPERISLVFPFSILFIVLALLFIGFAVWSWARWGKDDELIVPVRFTPPEHMSPLDCGYVIDGSVDFETDILPMIFYWADRGLMTIEDTGDGEYVFTKIAEPAEDTEKYERDLFALFFSAGRQVTTKDVVESKFLENSSRATDTIKHHYAANHPLKDRKAEKRKNTIKLLGILELAVFSFLVSIDHLEVFPFLIVPSVIMFAVNNAFSYAYFKRWNQRTRSRNVVYVSLEMIPNVVAALLLAAFLMIFGLPVWVIVLLAVLHNASLVVSSFIADASDRRSEFGTKLLSEVLGYREFLDKVEVDKLETLVEDDPGYFYHNLAYAACFGLTDKYVKKFAGLSYAQPEWMLGSAVDYWYWSSFSNSWRRNYMSEFASANATRAGSTVSGSSGFSGGGFSGGGGRGW